MLPQIIKRRSRVTAAHAEGLVLPNHRGSVRLCLARALPVQEGEHPNKEPGDDRDGHPNGSISWYLPPLPDLNETNYGNETNAGVEKNTSVRPPNSVNGIQ